MNRIKIALLTLVSLSMVACANGSSDSGSGDVNQELSNCISYNDLLRREHEVYKINMIKTMNYAAKNLYDNGASFQTCMTYMVISQSLNKSAINPVTEMDQDIYAELISGGFLADCPNHLP